MQAESGGDVRALSPKGAMGLMQIMPATWAALRQRYGLGADPYDPRDNITAGTAYLRELHDRFGERGFLAAYNAGPSRYEEHLATGRPLPSETLSYMATVKSLLANPGRELARCGIFGIEFAVRSDSESRPRSSPAITEASISTSIHERPTVHDRGFDAAVRRTVCSDIRSENTAMISVGPGLASAGCGGWQSVKGIGQQPPIHGRQGKSAASGRAHMVGRLEFCAPSGLRAGWRFSRKPERFQRRDRRRRLIEPICVP